MVDRARGAVTAVELRTAFHEAGHAVAVFLLGAEVAFVTAVADLSRWGGQCSWIGDCGAFGEATIAFAGPMAEQHAQRTGSLATERTRSLATERTRGIAPAGPSATAADDLDGIFGVEGALGRARQRHDRVGATSDHDAAFDALAEVSGSLEEITAALEFAKVRTRTLVQSPRFQVLVNRLAHVLLERGHLDGEAAMNELRRVDEVAEQADLPVQLVKNWLPRGRTEAGTEHAVFAEAVDRARDAAATAPMCEGEFGSEPTDPFANPDAAMDNDYQGGGPTRLGPRRMSRLDRLDIHHTDQGDEDDAA